jgi:hypothetical protein
MSWDILSRPYGTGPGAMTYPGLRPGLLSAVPAGLIPGATGATGSLKRRPLARTFQRRVPCRF